MRRAADPFRARWGENGLLRLHPAAPAARRARGARAARNERPMSVTSGTKRKEGGIAETARVIFHALIIALVIRTFLFQPFNIPSGSMKATLLVGDYLFVSKYSYGYSHYSLPFSPPLFSGPHLGVGRRSAATSWCSGCRSDDSHRLHQARDRAAGRPHPDDRRRAPHQRRSRSSASASRTSSRPRRAAHARASSAGARRCPTA